MNLTNLRGEWRGIEIPEHAETFELLGGVLISYDQELRQVATCLLPPDNWQIICLSGEVTEEMAKDIVETIHIEYAPSPYNDFAGSWDVGYVDYEHPGEFAGWQGDAGSFGKSVDSFHSLLRSKNLPINTTLILKKQ